MMEKYFESIPSQRGAFMSMNSTYISSLNATNNLTDVILSNVTQQCGLPRPDAFHIFRDPVNSDLPWPGLMIRTTIISTWFWCCDQVLREREREREILLHVLEPLICTEEFDDLS